MLQQEIEKFINAKFVSLANEDDAKWRTSYMKHHFKFLGVRGGRKIMAEVLKTFKPSLEQVVALAEHLYFKAEYREHQYFALYLLEKHAKKLNEQHLEMLAKMVVTDSWWDSVDPLSSNIIGIALLNVDEITKQKYLTKWENSGNMWLLRVCIIHQLKYKANTNLDYLAYICEKAKHHEDFFIRKAIGWALREYSKTSYSWVESFVEKNPELSNLSKREALRLLKYKDL